MNTISAFGARSLRRGLPGIFPALVPLVAAVLILALPVSMARGAPLLQNALSLGTASGASGTDVIVPLNLTNQDAVGGIQLDIAFDPAVVSFTGAVIAPRVTGMSIGASTPATGTLRVLMYFGGGGNIAAGTGAVANLTFHLVGTGSTALTPGAWELSDPTGHAIVGVTATAGGITVTGGTDPTGACCAPAGTCAVTTQAGCVAPNAWQGAATTCTPNPCPPPAANTLAIGTASGASGAQVVVPLGLHNTEAVGGLQLDILFDPAVVSFTSAAITSRATGMSIPSSVPAAGRLRLLMYSGEGGSITPGDGAVANLTFRMIGAPGSACDLTPDAATLADPTGHALQLTAYAGHITVTGGGDPTGACCAPAGTCAVTIQAACIAPSAWQGAGAACIPNPCPPPQTTEALSIGTVSGASGADVAVPLSLHNTLAIGGIQLDILFDPAVVSFTSAAITSRATGMSIPTSIPAAGRVRVVMYFGSGGNIPAGDGAVANLTFRIIGAQGSGCDLTPNGAILSDPDAQVVPVTATAGHITVTGGGDPTGACCAPAGTCAVTIQAACGAPSTWQGAGATCSPNPCPPPQTTETLSMGTVSGASGADVAVPLGLHNTVAIGGIQLDVLFDPAVVSFSSAAITSRATGMSIPTSIPSAGRLRVVMYFGGGGSIPAGDGAVANLTFRIVGAQGSSCELTPDAATLSDPEAQAVPVTATAGHIIVTGGSDPTGACCAPAGTCGLTTQPNCAAGIWQGANTTCTPNPCPLAPPDLRLAVLKNPGRTRTLQIFVSSDVGLDAPPNVVLSGGVAVPMTQLPGVNLFQGNTSVGDGTASVTVQATGIHGGATGTAQTTVTF